MKLLVVGLILLVASCDFMSHGKNNKTLFTNSEVVNQDSIKMKTIIVDVRSIEEWEQDGHADCTVNYPIDQFANHIESLKEYDKVVLVCRSGNRASYAHSMLTKAGFKNVENKGAWENISCE